MVIRSRQEFECSWWDRRGKHALSQPLVDGTMETLASTDPELTIHPLPSQEGVIVRIEPPQCPADGNLSHVPCDIVLVIDVSFSMSTAAPVVGVDDAGSVTREHAGYSVLDITKHAALTVLETLDARDRLGVVSFSTNAKIVQHLLPMNQSNKKLTAKRIRSLKEENATNLWQGIKQGLELFQDDQNSGRVPAVLVLTDGQPNHQNPLQGYVNGIRSMAPLPAAVHTFGFGNDIKSGLLKSIAEIGGGNYSFIPDAGMVGTVFVNAVAHLQSTFANRCCLKLTFPEALCLTKTTGESVECQQRDEFDLSDLGVVLGSDGPRRCTLTISVGNLQYGQSRDIYLSSGASDWSLQSAEKLNITAELNYSRMQAAQFVVHTTHDALMSTSLLEDTIAYHQSRSMICSYLASLFPLQPDGEHEMPCVSYSGIIAARRKFEQLLNRIPAKNFSDPYNRSLMQDVLGQIKLAVYDESYMRSWGPHYFLSLWDAHAKQMRNTFKDPGVQMYDAKSPLFLKCQEHLAHAFDTAVKPPEPSLKAQADHKYSSGRVTISMASYNHSDYPCFSASSLVALACGAQVPVGDLRKGMMVQTPMGNRKVVAVLKTRVRRITLCRIQGLLITPWHPVIEGNSWTFPADIAQQAVRYSGAIYSILLERHPNSQAHMIQVGGVWAVTLGHGITSGEDVRAHQFLGDYAKVSKAISLLGVGPDGVAVASGVRRERRGGQMAGFRSGSSRRVVAAPSTKS